MRLLRLFFLPLSVAVLAMASMVVPLPVFVEDPGQVIALGKRVRVDTAQAGDLRGEFLLTTVDLSRGTMVDLVVGLIDDDTELLRPERVLPPDIGDEDFFAQQRDVFDLTAQIAAAVGLRAAGFPVAPGTLSGDGAVVRGVVEGTPAEGVLAEGDVIVGVDGRDVDTAGGLRAAVGGQPRARDPLVIRYRRDGAVRSMVLTPVSIPDAPHPVIGVQIETANPRVDLPVPVHVDAGRIGGPSAGLMIALTVYDLAAADVDLAAGRRIAGTGGIAPDGSVTPIGGIRQKVVAAAAADVALFLTPVSQVAEARAGTPADSDLRIVGVGDFSEAVRALEVGGDVS